MSGPICPDCGSFDITSIDQNHDFCGFCGWKGEKLPRKIVSGDRLKKMGAAQTKNKKLKEEGKLYYLRVFCSSADDFDYVSGQIDETYHLTESYCYSTNYILYRISRNLSEDILKGLNEIEGVKEISIY